MTPRLRPFRSRVTRLLASVLVSMSLLVNGMGMALASSGAMKKDCCAHMMGSHGLSGHCDHGGKPGKAPGTDCDEQCLMRCQAANALPSFALALPVVALFDSALPESSSGAIPATESGPQLRPPISA